MEFTHLVQARGNPVKLGGVRRWLAEPTLHFLIFGAAVFAAHAWLAPPAAEESGGDVIAVPAEMVAGLREDFIARMGMAPTDSELNGLIDDHVGEEVLYREALALGLDRHDLVVRRRLVQNMQFLLQDISATEEPTEAELADFVRRRPERYGAPARLTFSHVFLSTDRRGPSSEREAIALLARLRAEGASTDDAVANGDPFMLGHRFRKQTRDQVANRFGPRFADTLMTLPVEAWSEPVGSRYGVHLVWVDERLEAGPPRLDRVRDRARRDLVAERRRHAERRKIAELRERYTVRIEQPGDDPRVKLAAKRGTARP